MGSRAIRQSSPFRWDAITITYNCTKSVLASGVIGIVQVPYPISARVKVAKKNRKMRNPRMSRSSMHGTVLAVRNSRCFLESNELMRRFAGREWKNEGTSHFSRKSNFSSALSNSHLVRAQLIFNVE